jgi:cysteine desulfuration protein SufE
MTIKEAQEEIVEEFSMFDEWMDKYEHIIELGKELPLIEDRYKTDDHLIKGCQSRVWLHAELVNGNVNFTADSDAIITKGIIGLVIRVFSGHTPKEIAETDLFFIDQIGLQEHLSPTRSNGLLSMLKQIKMYAIVFSSQSNC